MPPPASPPPFTLDTPTVLSLALAFSFVPAAQFLAGLNLPKSTPKRYYWIFVWCFYDFLTHTILEGSFLYHCFFSYETIKITSDHPHPASLGRSGPHFLGYANRNYGSYYAADGTLMSGLARLWREYAKADSRWGGADLTVISLELLTVFVAGPAALYSCSLISRIFNSNNSAEKGRLNARLWFILLALSTGELYGGFMTFAPEWLSANASLATDDPVYLWLYLFFFNTVWVWVPLWIMYEGYNELSAAFTNSASLRQSKKAT